MDPYFKICFTRLKSLSRKKRIIYCYKTCERLLPYYEEFTRKEKWGDTLLLFQAMHLVGEYIDEDKIYPKENLIDLLTQVYSVIPNQNEINFQTPCDYAQMASSAVYYMVNYLVKDDLKELTYVLTLSRDIVDSVVQNDLSLQGFEADLEDQISSHPLMIAEMKQQKDLYDTLNEGH